MLYFLVVAKLFLITLRVRTSNSALVDLVTSTNYQQELPHLQTLT